MSETATLTAVTTAREPRANVTVEVHDTPESIFDAMALISGGVEVGGGTHRWVVIRTEAGARINFHIGRPA